MNEPKEFTNLIGGEHTINQDIWALSLIRKFNADHAYLVMEGINSEQERIIMDAHLVQKKSNPKMADIVYRDISERFDELQAIGQSCSAYTWNINRFQADALVTLIQSEQQRANEDKINYVEFGKAKITGVFVSLPEDAKASLGDNASIDALMRDGHNCGSWAIAMVRKLELPFKGNYMPFLFVRPKSLIQDRHNGDAKEPDSQQKCLIM